MISLFTIQQAKKETKEYSHFDSFYFVSIAFWEFFFYVLLVVTSFFSSGQKIVHAHENATRKT